MINIDNKEGLTTGLGSTEIVPAVKAVLNHFEKAEEFDVTIFLTDDQHISELNQRWMDKIGPTDVLSFPSDEIDIDTGNQYLGDIILSVETTAEQALNNGHKIEEECQLLVVHGMLHLLGFDHYTEEEKTEMWDHQRKILTDLGLENIKLSE